MSPEKGNLIQIWLRGAVSGGFGPALSEFDAAGVPAPAARRVFSRALFSPCQPAGER
jgi:hypothetical protein